MKDKKIFIIAEAGVNHNGDPDIARKLIDTAKESGADAVKFQTFKAEKLVSKDTPVAEYQRKSRAGAAETQLDVLKRLELTFEEFIGLKEYCDKKGIIFMSTPFDKESADFLEGLVKTYKIASCEITNLPFLEYIAQKHKPIILSTAMSTLDEIKTAVQVIQNKQKCSKDTEFSPLTLLHCTASYPCSYEEVNLNAMLTMRKIFKLPVGYSDHTLGIEVAIAASAMGAAVIEKHFTLDRNMKGPDQKSSLDPAELKTMVTSIRNIENAMGDGIKKPTAYEMKNMVVSRKSLITSKSLKKGQVMTREMIDIKRPAYGVAPADLEKVLGLKLNKNKKQDEVLKWEDFILEKHIKAKYNQSI